MMNLFTKLGMILAVALTCMSLPAMADVKVVDTQSGGKPMTISTKFGKVVDAVNIGGESLKCDDVSFIGLTVPENTTPKHVIQTTPFTVTLSTTSGNLRSVVFGGGDALFHSEVYAEKFENISLLISGLDPKQTYQIQYLHGDMRTEEWARYQETPQTITDSKGNKVTPPLAFNTAADKDQYVILTVEVTGSESVQYDMPKSAGATSRGPSFSGFVVLQKP